MLGIAWIAVSTARTGSRAPALAWIASPMGNPSAIAAAADPSASATCRTNSRQNTSDRTAYSRITDNPSRRPAWRTASTRRDVTATARTRRPGDGRARATASVSASAMQIAASQKPQSGETRASLLPAGTSVVDATITPANTPERPVAGARILAAGLG